VGESSGRSTPGAASGRAVTRLAPSPTGALHLGNASTFLVNWAMARRAGWRVVMRIEDLDGPRVKPGADRDALSVLDWLGLDWDGEVRYQLRDLEPYREAVGRLAAEGWIYRCGCTRREIAEAQSAPHGGDGPPGVTRYPGTCRPAGEAPWVGGPVTGDLAAPGVAWRLAAPDHVMTFTDQVRGEQRIDVAADVGDFVIATKAGLPAYQLAVVVDDARQGVTEVVRGADLLASTGRQLWIQTLLGISPSPNYTHLPLLVGPDGRRLAKRHGDTRLSTYRERGVKPQRVIGLVASLLGLAGPLRAMCIDEFLDATPRLDLARETVTFSPEHEAWLVAES